MERRKEMFYLMMHSTHFIYGYMAGFFGGGIVGGCVSVHINHDCKVISKIIQYKIQCRELCKIKLCSLKFTIKQIWSAI